MISTGLLLAALLASAAAQLRPNDTGRSCAPGDYDNGNVCLPCPPNTISKTPGSFQCTPCPTGTTAAISRTRCGRGLGCAPGDYLDLVTRTAFCAPCPKDTYSSTYNAATCSACPANFSTSDTGGTRRSDCFACPRGQYMLSTAYSRCRACEGGQYQDEPAQLVCKSCPPGTGQLYNEAPEDMTSVAACTECPSGMFSTTSTRGRIFFVIGPSRRCVRCPAGSYAPASRTTQCTKCPEGTYAAPDRTYCIALTATARTCPPGQGKNPQGACEPCPDGTVSPGDSATACAPCARAGLEPNTERSACVCRGGNARGFHYVEGGRCERCPAPWRPRRPDGRCGCAAGLEIGISGECECPVGSIADSTPGTCRVCSRSEVNYDSGCAVCSDGDFRAPRGAGCARCPPGTTSSSPNVALRCKPCKNSYTDARGTTRCGCPPGSQPDATGGCRLCPSGSYSPDGTTCYKCGSGRFSVSPGARFCKQCPWRQRHGAEGRTTCPPPCPRGSRPDGGDRCECLPKYLDVTPRSNTRGGTPVCSPCPRNAEADRYGSAKCVCADGAFARPDGRCARCPGGSERRAGRCVQCPRNFVSAFGARVCARCPPHTFSLQTAGKWCTQCDPGEFLTQNASCSTCNPGFRVRNGQCIPCMDSVSEGGNVGFCTPCPPGKRPAPNGRVCV